MPSVSRDIVVGGLKLVALGLPGAYAAGRMMQGMLFRVAATDPLTLGGVASFLSLVAVAACLLPARRAAGVDPVDAFRSE